MTSSMQCMNCSAEAPLTKSGFQQPPAVTAFMDDLMVTTTSVPLHPGTQMPSVTEKSIRSLGKVFDCTLRDTAALQAISSELEAWLTAVDNTGLLGKFEAWIYQYCFLPQLLWLLLLY